MKTKLKLIVIGTLLVTTALAAPPATISNPVTPGTISYQGRLQTPEGVNYTNGVYEIEFRIYNAVSEGDLLWGATYKPYVQNGYFSIILGATGVGEVELDDAPAPTYPVIGDFWKAMWVDPANTVQANANRYLDMTVLQDKDNNTINSPPPQPSFPRQQFLASPYAIQAQYAQSAARSDANFLVSSNLTVAGVTTVNDITLTTTNKPFNVKSFMRSNASHYGNEIPTLYPTNNYTAMVVGFDAGRGDINESNTHNLWNVMVYVKDGNWWIRTESPTHGDVDRPTWTVHVLFIRNDFVDDQRVDWGKND